MEEVEPLSPITRITHSPKLNCFIIAVFGLSSRINVDKIKYGLTQTLIKHPRFSSKLVFDAKDATEPIGWVRTKVNVHDHIIEPDLDPNMDSPDHFVEDYISNISKTSMDLSKPLWEFHVLNVKTSNAISTGVFRFHHSLGDGVSLISVLLACVRKTSDPDALPSLPIPKNKKKPQISTKSMFSKYFFSLLLLFKMLWNTLMGLAPLMANLKDNNNLMKDTPSVEQGPRRFVYKMLSLDDIKLVKNAMGVTINDVLLGITQASLSRYLSRKHGKDHGDDDAKDRRSLKHIRLRATVPINIRPNTMIEGLHVMMEANIKGKWDWGNSIGYVLLPLHIALRDDPLDYIRDAKATIDRKKQSFEAQLSYLTSKLLIKTLGLKAAVAVMYKALSNSTLTFSNVVGPIEEISFYGHPITFFAPSVYGLPQALTIHFQSYMDKMTVVLAVDEDVIPDPHNLCDAIEKSLGLAKSAITWKKKCQ